MYDKARIILNGGADEEINLSWDEFIGAAELGNAKEIRNISETIKMRQLKLFGHLIRSNEHDLMRRPCLDQEYKVPELPGPKRAGKKRYNWIKRL